MTIYEQLVNFHDYCAKCRYNHLDENMEPCDTCLSEPTNVECEKPINYKPRMKEGK